MSQVASGGMRDGKDNPAGTHSTASSAARRVRKRLHGAEFHARYSIRPRPAGDPS
jgi:hypothetical protein